MIKRRYARAVKIGSVQVGGNASISVQSMTNTDTRDTASTIKQIKELEDEGCEIIRVAVPDQVAAEGLARIISSINIPLIADIHFNYHLALEALKSGVHGLRINPGNIGGDDRVAAIVAAASQRRVPVRIGVNAGSLEKDLLKAHGGVTAEGMVESALRHIRILEGLDYKEIKVSLKASHVPLMVEAYRRLAAKVDYPLHVGVTEAGTPRAGSIKSALGIGILLAEGIGDTIRVSLTGHPRHEVRAGFDILRFLGLREKGVELISCPTCGRTQIDLISIASEVEEKLAGLDMPLKIAVMGCVVNGPGEARDADVGIAGGKGEGLLFKKGRVVRKIKEDRLISELLNEVYSMYKDWKRRV